MTNKEKMIRILCDALNGCPLTYPCDKLWSPEGWCKDHCKAGQQEPDAECWLKYAEVMTSEVLQAQDVPDINVGDTVSRQKAIDALCKRCDLVNDDTCGEKCIDIKILEKLPSAQPDIIHCRECKNCQIDSVFHDYWCDGRKVWKDHYCGYAERRTDGRD